MGIDGKLVAWARRVKARAPAGVPPLWLFTDATRLPDPLRAIAALPRGLSGVVIRHGAPSPRLLSLCRHRGIVCAGRHLRRGIRAAGPPAAFVTSSAHDAAEARRALRAGAALIFISPVFSTASHPGAPSLGVRGWHRLAQACRGRAAALGGIDAGAVARLPPICRAVGAISALTLAPDAKRPG